MLVLGLCCHHHDSSACLLNDGELVAYVEEERLARVKYTHAFPVNAIRECLAIAGAELADVERAGFFWVPWKGIPSRLAAVRLWWPRSTEMPRRYGRFRQMLGVPLVLRRMGFRGQFHFVDHYLAHAAISYLLSPFDRAAILVLDGNGEIHTSWAGAGEGADLTEFFRVRFPCSLGRVYGFTTVHLGYNEHQEEGKVMALAALGDPERFTPIFRRIVRCRPGGRFEIAPGYFDHHIEHRKLTTPRFTDVFGPPRGRHDPFEQRHYDLAAALQIVTEETVLHMVRHLHDRTGAKNLSLGGGVALNCAMNGRLAREGPFEQLYIPPPAGDAGAALGAALHVHRTLLGGRRPEPLTHAYWGPSYSSAACRAAVERRGLPYRRSETPAADAARLVADGKVVGWFQGRIEMGPRALGARSIVADPRDKASADRVNDQVKHREPYRPFAPSVLAEHAHELFDTTQDSPFMLMAYHCRPAMQDRIPAVCHVDGTGRVQSVGPEAHPRWRQLLEAFHEISGVPAVLNTSFNRNGEPIVCSPDDALDCFTGSRMDALVLDDLVLTRAGDGDATGQDAESAVS